MVLPLLERTREQSATFLLTPKYGLACAGEPRGSTTIETVTPKIPQRTLEEGEQYRFHFDMTKCIGCKCCVVACNEQNGNPAEINWRRVGEIEGGWYPNTQRLHLSMGCNHCLEPTCLAGCPVDAYSKDPKTGVVIHSADACIGCQYCTWNCSYGVPQYNPERGVVGKCEWIGLPGSEVAGSATALAGVAGVTASACIYLVRPRPAWNSKHTVAEFYLTGALLGPLLAATMQLGSRRWLTMLIVGVASVQLLNLALKFLWLASSDTFELKATARLLSTQLRFLLICRSALLVLGGIVVPLWSTSMIATVAALGAVLCGELVGRYLFFVSVVPKNMAASYLTAGKVAA